MPEKLHPAPEFSKGVYWVFVRVKKEDSAFFYTVLEAQDGIVSYSTLPGPITDHFRDMELQVPEKYLEECDRLLGSLGDLVFRLPGRPPVQSKI